MIGDDRDAGATTMLMTATATPARVADGEDQMDVVVAYDCSFFRGFGSK